MGRGGYPPEFRRRVLDLVEAGRKVAEVAEDLGISGQTVYTWRRQDRIDRGLKPGLTSVEKAELVAARRQGQAADPRSGEGGDSVRECRYNSRHADLSDTGRRLVRLDQVHFDRRRRLHARHRVAVEVLGDDVAAVSENDLAPGGRAESVEDSALDLLADEVGVDHDSAVEGEHDAVDVDAAALVERDVRDLRAVAQEAAAGNAARVTFGAGRAPRRAFGCELERVQGSGVVCK
jgi:transposase-like protein